MTDANLPPQCEAGSFRDPSGFVFRDGSIVYRQINRCYADDYAAVMESGLYQDLVDRGQLVPHEEAPVSCSPDGQAWKVIRPQAIPFISYPYEWCFGQLRDAALLTLEIMRLALAKDLILKDASAYNVQFAGCQPVFIDTLSFERRKEGKPWSGYRQFCQHFLAPLALMKYRSLQLNHLLKDFLDGIPLPVASRLLPGRTRFRFSLLTHLHLHARAQDRYADKPVAGTAHLGMRKRALLSLVEHLRLTVESLRLPQRKTEWSEYYDNTNYSSDAMRNKMLLVEKFIQQAHPASVWDLGANTGQFSRLASSRGIPVVAFDIDPLAVELNYREGRKTRELLLLPLVMDLTNPSPGLGWDNAERKTLQERGSPGLLLALALIHHLAIGNNVPLPKLADFFARLGPRLVVEFIPKEDSMVQRLLRSREDIFPSYTEQGFQAAFSRRFHIRDRQEIPESRRVLFLLERHEA